jgi:hypothetical protein
LRSASFASDEREDVKNRSDTAKIASHTHKPIFHTVMSVRQDFNVLAYAPQAINFSQEVFESDSDCRFIGR